jgi:hypothetical protein
VPLRDAALAASMYTHACSTASTWANVIYDRNAALDYTDFEYATVVVGASGPSAAGGFYYALDVTDPLKPRFLWQLKSANNNSANGNPGEPLFGENTPGAAITTIRYREKGSANIKTLASQCCSAARRARRLHDVTDRRVDPAPT